MKLSKGLLKLSGSTATVDLDGALVSDDVAVELTSLFGMVVDLEGGEIMLLVLLEVLRVVRSVVPFMTLEFRDPKKLDTEFASAAANSAILETVFASAAANSANSWVDDERMGMDEKLREEILFDNAVDVVKDDNPWEYDKEGTPLLFSTRIISKGTLLSLAVSGS